MARRRSIKKRYSRYKKSKSETNGNGTIKKSKPTNLIPQEVKDSENARCGAWNGDETECKANDCWYYRDSKKCKMHTFHVADKIKNKSKKKYRRSSKKRSSRRR